MSFIVKYLGKYPARMLRGHNYEVVAEADATKFRTKRAARLGAKFAGIPVKMRTIEPLKL